MNSLRDKAYALKKYSDLEGTEIGELCSLLIESANREDYFLSEGFSLALGLELDAHLSNFEDFSEIVETEEIITRKVSTIEWY